MAKKEISIVLRAKNAMAAGLSKASKSLKAFGKSALRIGKTVAVGFLAATAALVAFATKAVAAYAIQEKAERSLISAMDVHGQAGDDLIPHLKRVAAAIQDETGAADESTLAGMAKMRMLGVMTSKLGEAAKGVVALTSLGLKEEAAMKAVAMAIQGDYEMLNRYVPALRQATSETEKATIVNDLFAKGYEQQKGLLNTVGGQWTVLKGRVGDLWEELGAAIAKNEGLMRTMRRAGDAVKEFGQRINRWVNSDRFKEIATSIEGIVAAIASGGEDRSKAVGLVGEVLVASFARGAEIAVEALKTAAPKIGKLLGNAARWAWDAMTGASVSDKEKASKQLLKEQGGVYGNIGAWNIEVKKRAEQIKTDRLTEKYGAKDVKATEGKTAAQKRLNLALKATLDFGAEMATKEKNRSDEKAAQNTAQAKLDLELAQQQIELITKEEEAAAALAAAKKKAADDEKKAAEDEKKAAEDEKKAAKDAVKLLNDELSAIKAQKSAVEELAKSRVQTVIDNARAAKDEAKSRDADYKKAMRLAEKERKGIRLSSKNKEFLEAAREIERAKAKSAKLGAAEKSVEAGITAAEKSVKVQEDMKTSLKKIETTIGGAVTYPG